MTFEKDVTAQRLVEGIDSINIVCVQISNHFTGALTGLRLIANVY